MSELIADIKELLGSGLFPSLPGRRARLWKDGRNVTFADQLVETALGQFLMFDPEQASSVTGVKASVIAGIPTVFFGTLTKLWQWDVTNGLEDLSGTTYTGTTEDLWVFARFGDFMLATNNVDPLQVYKGVTDFEDLAGTPFTRCKTIYATDTHLLAFNTSNGGNFIEWTDADDIEDWTATSTNDAGNVPKRNLDSDILAVKTLGKAIAVYTFNEMLLMDFVGRPFVFRSELLLEGFGAVGVNAIAASGRQHYGIGRRGIWTTDGISFDFIQNPAMQKFVYRDAATRIDLDTIGLTVGWLDQLQNQIVFYYTTEAGPGYNDIGIGIEIDTGAWSVYDFGRTAVDDSGVFPFAITADRLGNVYQQSVTGVPTTTGQQGVIDLTETSFSVSMGLGEGGLGEGGLGGFTGGAG